MCAVLRGPPCAWKCSRAFRHAVVIAMADEEPTRCANDGKQYALAEFRKHYGLRAGEAAWEEAGKREKEARAPVNRSGESESAELAHESVPRTSMEPPALVQASPAVAPSPRAACAGTVGGELPRTSTAPLASIEAPPPVAPLSSAREEPVSPPEASASEQTSTEPPAPTPAQQVVQIAHRQDTPAPPPPKEPSSRAEAGVDGARAGAAEHGELVPRRVFLLMKT